MKLSREGAARLGRHEARGFPVGDFEFKPEDFDGLFHFGKDHIALTVEEAGILTRCAANEFCRLIMEHAPIDLARQVEVLMYDLVKRIEQAEIKHLKREIAQLKKEQARDNLEIERLEEGYKNSTYSALEQVGTEKCDA